ncbi:hypothetical protein P691DRAFT_765107 [Macrolepiota fuliginosa MF-IS2]|uniref:Small ribosomal subunit protein mS33 n=1 Tax=Macrolepiota fuliginosa MF-IS2 TaxID=1400762 RepID=A0A9P6BX21_9AGAR|nr:hypothetical protein P691DRAFT_765107 [Macrolepiota fuliginosa MF-IS2]
MNALPWLSATGKRLFALNQVRAEVFQTAFNPTSVRTGAKYLRRRLRGPAMVNYYPPTLNMAHIVRRYPELEMVNDEEQTRLEDIEIKKKRGKATPKKARTPGESRRAGKKR